MALSTDAIFQPLDDFFTRIGQGPGVPARFRFDHRPRAFPAADFLLPGHPELGASPQVAQELFSRAVDGVVRLDGGGRDVWLGASRFSELYTDEILGPAAAFVPPTVKDAAERQACIAAFDATKAAALKKAQLRTASLLQGAGATFSPCVATPANWFDTADAGPWTSQSFDVAAVAASAAEISFDYCIVDIGRPWYHAAFIDDGFWRVPGQAKGALSANDGHGQPALPVACVAICRLRIRADWTPEDIGNLEQSAQFGPFNIDSTVKDGAIGHEGVQIIGWLLQDMPLLPPQGSDAAVAEPVRGGDINGTWTDSDGFTYVFTQDGGDFSYSQRRDGAEVGTGTGRIVGGQLTYRYSSGQDAGTCTGQLGPDGDHIDGTCTSGGDSWKFGIWR